MQKVAMVEDGAAAEDMGADFEEDTEHTALTVQDMAPGTTEAIARDTTEDMVLRTTEDIEADTMVADTVTQLMGLASDHTSPTLHMVGTVSVHRKRFTAMPAISANPLWMIRFCYLPLLSLSTRTLRLMRHRRPS